MWIGVLAAVGPPARHEEAGRAALVGLGQHQVAVAHRRREEPLVAGEHDIRRPTAPLPAGTARVVLVRRSLPPCFSVMPMPTVIERFCVERHVARVVLHARPACRPSAAYSGALQPHHRDAGLGHRRRAGRARLDLAVHVERGGVGRPRPRAARRRTAGWRCRCAARSTSWCARRDGTRPGRCARRCASACAARARSGWRPRRRASVGSAPYSAPWRTSSASRHRGAAAFDRAAQRGVAGVDVVVLELGGLVVGVDADHGVSWIDAGTPL